jgi:hypothetical protein
MSNIIGSWKHKGIELAAWQGTDKISFTFRKSYKDKATNEWKESKHLFPEEVVAVAALFNRATAWISETGISLNPAHTFSSAKDVVDGIRIPGAHTMTLGASRLPQIIDHALLARGYKSASVLGDTVRLCNWNKAETPNTSRQFWLQSVYLYGGSGDYYTDFEHWSQVSRDTFATRQQHLDTLTEGEEPQGVARQLKGQQWVEHWDAEKKKFACYNIEPYL